MDAYFFDRTGKLAIGSRLRSLTDRITDDAAQIYRMYGVDFKPKWFPVFFVLSHDGAAAVTQIARRIGQSHPSVSNIVREMEAQGIVRTNEDDADGRKNVIVLTEKGRETAAVIDELSEDVSAAVEALTARTRNDLWTAVGEWEEQLSESSLSERVREARRLRIRREVEIVPYTAQYRAAFRTLNEAWITSFWHLEEADIEALDHPETHILDRGGYIFVALHRGEPVGVCALCKSDDPAYDYELAKLAVDVRMRGGGIGLLLGRAVVGKAAELGASRIFLESNTRLEAAIGLYRKLGFRKIVGRSPHYERGDILMELFLNGKEL